MIGKTKSILVDCALELDCLAIFPNEVDHSFPINPDLIEGVLSACS